MKRLLLLTILLLGVLSLTACISITPENQEDDNGGDANTSAGVVVEGLEKIEIEIGETYDLRHSVKDPKDLIVSTAQTNILTINNNILLGVAAGDAEIELKLDGNTQKVKVVVHEIGALSNSFTICKERFANKRLVAFGDSVTYSSGTPGGNTYVENIAYKFKMQVPNNYAIGGSTGTYMSVGSNIYKEYKDNTEAIDGVRFIKNLYDNGELATVDYAIIAYGHNDQYFQPVLTAPGDDAYDVNSFASCDSFKGSYRHMINTLKLGNPRMRIIVLGCTYSEYQFANPSRYGNTYNYDDYRQAMKDVAEELNVTYIDPWDYMQGYFDCYDRSYYYRDTVHLTVEGHKLLANYICNYRK